MRFILVEKEVREERLAICRECPKFKKTLKLCSICGCFMPAKTWMHNQTCPQNLWGREDERVDEFESMEEHSAVLLGERKNHINSFGDKE